MFTHRYLVVVEQKFFEVPEMLERIGWDQRDAVAHHLDLTGVLRDVLRRQRIQACLLA